VLIAKILQESRAGEMPPVQYRVLHWGSQLTSADLAAIRSLSKTTLDETKTEAPGDAERGRLVFQKRCTGCHALNADREGPRLGGVFGRKAGVVQGFNYSAGLRNSGLTWDEATLERWLTDPDVMVPDTRMDFLLPKAQERHDLIAYFRQ
jgi:cytochrome c